MAALELNHLLPAPVLGRLRQNLRDNTERTHGMIAESIDIQRDFRDARVRYGVLKGLSLWPNSVRRPELRSQFDLDFLIADEDLPEARKILARRGYRLYGQNGRSWEFKRNERPGITVKDLYKHLESWVVELHADPDASSHSSIFRRLQSRELAGFSMPVLPPVDLFLRQCLHAYKHTCSEFLRAAILIEFRRHVLFRCDDRAFWDELHSTAHQDRQACLALGVVTLLISRVMGDFAPEALTSWTVTRLPQNAKLWIELYGHRAVLESFPGSKLYLLMPSLIEAAGGSPSQNVRRKLLPLCVPPPAIRAVPNEPIPRRIHRYRMQFAIIVSRLRFHVVEGLRFGYERRHWRQHLKEIAS